MDFLQEYESSDSEATDVYNSTNIDVKASDKRASTSVLNVRAVRQVYLITYSQVDLHKFPDRNSFAQAVLRSFNSSNTNVEHWVCCKEVHESTGGYHYHMAVKLQRCKRWLSCKRYLEENYGISVHFSDVHHNYYSAWKYTTKKDKFVVESDGHPDLSDCKGPKTETASLCRKKYIEDSDDDEEEFSEEFYESPSDDASETCHESDSKGKKRKKRLSSFALRNNCSKGSKNSHATVGLYEQPKVREEKRHCRVYHQQRAPVTPQNVTIDTKCNISTKCNINPKCNNF